MGEDKNENQPGLTVFSREQEAILDLYLDNLDSVFAGLQAAERTEVEIETEHLKRLLTKWEA